MLDYLTDLPLTLQYLRNDMQQFDVIILGNGILGMSTALELTKVAPTMRIAVIGSTHREGGATVAAGAMLGCFGEVTTTTFSSAYDRTVLSLATSAAKMWPAWLDELNQDLSKELKTHSCPGTFIISNTESSKYENDNFDAILTALNEYNEPFETVDPNHIPGLMPLDRCRPLRSIFLSDEGAINPNKLLTAMSAVLQQKNVTFLDELAIDFSCSSAKIQQVVTNLGTELTADKILIATGAYSQTLLDKIPCLAGSIPRVFAGTGCSAILDNVENKIPLNSVIRSPNRANACGVHVLPCDGQADQLYLGASNTGVIYPKTTPRTRDIYYLLKRAMEQVNSDFHNKNMIKYQIGNRPVTMDTYPLIGKTSLENLWILTGTYRIGIQLAPLLAKFISHCMVGSDIIINHNLDAFLPEREPITTLNKEQAIKEFVKQYFGTSYEHAMVLPKLGWESVMKEAFHSRAENIYNELETEVGLHPHVLMMLEQNREYIPIIKNELKKQKTIYNSLASIK